MLPREKTETVSWPNPLLNFSNRDEIAEIDSDSHSFGNNQCWKRFEAAAEHRTSFFSVSSQAILQDYHVPWIVCRVAAFCRVFCWGRSALRLEK